MKLFDPMSGPVQREVEVAKRPESLKGLRLGLPAAGHPAGAAARPGFACPRGGDGERPPRQNRAGAVGRAPRVPLIV